jgi:exopolyphosphatase / guanosine-5'-triphosphate,3'-diphosphate pyrophosphatase
MASTLNSETIAALDIGTNSFHMVVAKIVDQGFEVIAREKENVRIGHGAGEMKELSAEAIERGITCLQRMQQVAQSLNADIVAVATSAVREAKNKGDFLRRARKESGIDIQVISGVEEARLIHLGALHAIGQPEAAMFLCDIGGGSTEIVIGSDDEEMLARSFKLGAVRLTNRFFSTDSLHPSAVGSCRTFVRSTLMVIQPDISELGFDIAVASSGSAETVVRIIHAQSGQPEPKTFNRYQFTRTQIAEVVQALAACSTIEERQKKFGIDKNRAQIILAGAIILEAICDVYGIGTLMFSDYALREGLLIDSLRKRGLGPQSNDHDPAMHSVRQLAERCDDRIEHSENVARLSGQLFDQLAKTLNVPTESRRLLEAGALLANVGVVISHSKHHLHSYYVIRNSELVGLSDREIELIAQIARYHRKGEPKLDHAPYAALSPNDQHLVRSLSALLRVAVGLDRTHDGRVKKVAVAVGDQETTIEFSGSKKLDNELNEYAANERKALLSDVLNTRLKIVSSKS